MMELVEVEISVQVHPNDVQAQELEGVPYGKTECWYVVEAEEGAELIIGHTARSEDELSDHINNGQWDRLLTRQSVTKEDFIFVPSGTVHTIGKEIMVLETQQSSDTTYRLYDFDRTYDFGHTRELHLDKAMTVTIIPQEVIMSEVRSQKVEGGQIKRLVKVPEFNVYHVQSKSGFELKAMNRFRAITILNGEGSIGTLDVSAGDHLMLTMSTSYRIEGDLEWIMSDVPLPSSI